MEGSRKRARRLLAVAASVLSTTLVLAAAGAAGDKAGFDIAGLQLPEPVVSSQGVHKATGQVNAVVRLKDAPLAVVNGKNWKQSGGTLNPAQQRSYAQGLAREQGVLIPKIRGLGGTHLASLTKALNAVIVSIDASKLDDVAKLPNVASVREIGDYELDLSETVPYIGAAAVQSGGVDGTGVTVAVLDSGIDYTHASMGGAGTAAAYEDAYGDRTKDRDNTVINNKPPATGDDFPTAKVIGGFDFVGEEWPSGALDPDPDPIDCGDAVIAPPCAGGHGTHVADIIAGVGASEGVGTAPGAKLLAAKVCSAVSTSCSGVALLQGMEFALDPNGDGNVADAADVINMSLGSNYGQKEDDLSFASTNAVNAGVVVVAAAGNAADRPYIVSSPSTTPEVISVAQTQVPSAKLYLIDPSAAGFPSVGGSHQSWSATPSLVTGDLVYDTTSLATKRGCSAATGTADNPTANPWVGTPLAGKIVLVERGVCNVSWKVFNVGQAGGIAAVISNNALQAPGDLPPDFSFGGPGLPPLAISGYTITLRDANTLKGLPETTAVNTNPAATNAFNQPATIDPATASSLVGNMVASSARGPSYSFNAIKPDIGAPGASNSAEAGTGTANTAFGGTSGATPMVAGSAALLLDKYNGARTPVEIKSLLMNTGETNIGLNPVRLPGVLAPITRIGGGEVRADDAAASNTAAWDDADDTGSLSFGFHTVSSNKTVTKTVRVRNYGGSSVTYNISSGFRYSSDASSGAVSLSHPSAVTVPANSSRTFAVTLEVAAAALPLWDLNGGSRGGDGFRLQGVEFDGYVNVSGGGDNVHLAWHVLPRRSADVQPASSTLRLRGGSGTLNLRNRSKVENGVVEVFSLIGTSPQVPASALPGPGDNFAVIDMKSLGVRVVDTTAAPGGEVLQFGINTFGARSHPNYPAEFDIYIDADRNGTDDYVIFNAENGGFGVTGQNLVFIQRLTPTAGTPTAFFFNDADLNSENVIYTVPISSAAFSGVPFTPTTQFDVDVFAFDNYFTGALTDSIVGKTYDLDTPKFAAGAAQLVVPADGNATLSASSVAGGAAASPSQTGFLLMKRLDLAPNEADAITVSGS